MNAHRSPRQPSNQGACFATAFWGARWSLLAIITALWIALAPAITLAQDGPPAFIGEAAVVVDGRVVFNVKDTETLSATQRARHINRELLREIKSPEPASIQVIHDRQRNLVYLQSNTSQDILITVTQADVVVPGGEPEQASEWAQSLQAALRRGQLERRPAYLNQAILYSIIAFIGAVMLHIGIYVLTRWGYRRLCRWFEYNSYRFNEWEKPVKVIWHLGNFGLKLGLWVVVAYYITDIIPQARIWRYGIINILTSPVIQFGEGRYSALELLLLILGTVGLWFGTNAIIYFLRMYVLSQARLERRVQDIVSVLVKYALIFLGIVILFQLWGIDASSLTILASVLGVGIGFGVQNITNNFISGFVITLERPIQVGDFINVGDLVGTVEKVGARSTEILTLDQVTIIVPNSRFLESEVINWSHGNSVSRLHIPVGVAYGSDIALVKQALLEAIRRHPEVLVRPKPDVFFQRFGDSALEFEVMVWTGEPRKQFKVKSDLNYAIEASLRKHGISIPFPQRDLHLQSPQLDDMLAILRHTVLNTTQAPPSSPETTPSAASALHPRPNPSLDSRPKGQNAIANDDQPPRQDSERGPFYQSAQPTVTDGAILSPDLDLEIMVQEMQGAQGIDIGDRRINNQSYSASFTGTQVVEWLGQQRDYTENEAMVIGQWLLQQGLIRSVTESEGFKNGHHLYQFYRIERPQDIATETGPETGLKTGSEPAPEPAPQPDPKTGTNPPSQS